MKVIAIIVFSLVAVEGFAGNDDKLRNARASSASTESTERGPKALQKFIDSAPQRKRVQPLSLTRSTSITTDDRPSSSYQLPTSTLQRPEDINQSPVFPPVATPASTSRQENSIPSLLLLRHFRKQTPPVQSVPQPTVILSQETGTGEAHPRLPARFVDTTALITKSSAEKVRNNSSANHHHDLFQHVSSNAQSFPGLSSQAATEMESTANGYGIFFRKGTGQNIVSTKPTFNPQYGQSAMVNSKKRYSSVYNEFGSTQAPHNPLQANNSIKIDVGTPGLSGLLVPDSQNRHLLKLLELLRKRHQTDGFRNKTVTSEATDAVYVSTHSPIDNNNQNAYLMNKASTTGSPKLEAVLYTYPSASYPNDDALRDISPPVLEFNSNPGPNGNYLGSVPRVTNSPQRIPMPYSYPQWLNNLGATNNQRIYNSLVPTDTAGSLMSLLPHLTQPPSELNRIGIADTAPQETGTVSTSRNTSTDQSTEEFLSLASEMSPLEDGTGAEPAVFGKDQGNLLHLVTASPVEKDNLVVNMFEQVFSKDEMKHNPLVEQLHNRLEDKLEGLQLNAIGNPAFGFLLYFVVPFVIIATITFTVMGVAPEYVGFTGLLIPLVIMATLTDVGRSARKIRGRRNVRDASGDENGNYINGKDSLMEDAHYNLLRHLEAVERSYLGS